MPAASRIAALPRRDWLARAPELIRQGTEAFKTPNGQQTLRPEQAVGLAELIETGGLFLSGPVGVGKLLLAALAFTALGAKRPLLLMPANPIDRQKKHLRRLAEHWRIPNFIQFESYETIAHPDNDDFFKKCWPNPYDVIVCDESHKLRRLIQTRNDARAAVAAKRFEEFMHETDRQSHRVHCAFLSATPWVTTFLDLPHMIWWALRERAPVPRELEHVLAWAQCLDSGDGIFAAPHALQQVSYDLQTQVSTPAEARVAVAERLAATPGIILSENVYDDHPVTFAALKLPTPPELEPHFRQLRDYDETPSGWTTADAFETHRIICQLSLGYYQEFDPRPPAEWLAARKAWAKFCRMLIFANCGYHSEGHVKAAVEAGKLRSIEFETWNLIRPTFEPTTKVHWLSDHAIDAAAEWGARKQRGLVWVDSIPFGLRLAKKTGWPYFRNDGLAKNGEHVEDTKAPVAILARKACQEALNLQYQWNTALFTAPMSLAKDWEQAPGRIARSGQENAVHIDYFEACPEHAKAVSKALFRADQAQTFVKAEQKILRLKDS